MLRASLIAVHAADVAHRRCEYRENPIRPAVHAAFYDATNKRYVIDEQVYYAMPLLSGVTPESERPGN